MWRRPLAHPTPPREVSAVTPPQRRRTLNASSDDPGSLILHHWTRLSRLPAGRWLFHRLLGRMVPYTGALGARVEELSPGHARVSLADRREVRNHLRSIHAVALVNLGELATGLATLTALPPGVRGIVTELSARYHAKARGRLETLCRIEGELAPGETVEAVARITDASGRAVATVTALWTLGKAP